MANAFNYLIKYLMLCLTSLSKLLFCSTVPSPDGFKCLHPCVTELLSMPSPLTSTLGILSVGGMTLLWRDISSQIKGQNRTLSSLLSQYFAVKFVGWLGKRQRSKLEADTLNVRQVQEETLLKRLRKNAQTYYGKQYDFSSIKGKKTS